MPSASRIIPSQPFAVLEGLFSLENARTELVRIGRKIVDSDKSMKAYSQRQCALAERALQGEYTAGAILLLDRTRMTSLEQLWQYRQFMALISGYKPAQKTDAWIEAEEADERLVNDFRQDAPAHISIEGIILKQAEPKSPLELCQEIKFGYQREPQNQELISLIKEIITPDFETAQEIIKTEYQNAIQNDTLQNRLYAMFLRKHYEKFLPNFLLEQDVEF